MESKAAIDRLSALAHPGRLEVFRMLVRAGPEGMPAGDVASRLGVAPNTLSARFTLLEQAGLISGVREGRVIRYAANMESISTLIVFLMEDCCGGHPELCGPVELAAKAACCAPVKTKPRSALRR